PATAPRFDTLFAQRSNSMSWVTPRSTVIGSYVVVPGDLWGIDGSPPSRCTTTSVVRRSALTLEMPAVYRPSHFRRNLKFLYGSWRCALTENSAMTTPPMHAQDAAAPKRCLLLVSCRDWPIKFYR